MEEVKLFIDWLMTCFKSLYDFFSRQHPIVQARVFMPLAMIVIALIFLLIKTLFKGGSLG